MIYIITKLRYNAGRQNLLVGRRLQVHVAYNILYSAREGKIIILIK
jgi:hypothetical protein